MYDDLILRLRDAAKMSEALAVLLPHSDGNAAANLYVEYFCIDFEPKEGE